MSKPAYQTKRAGNEAVATLHRVRTSPIKLNLVAQMIRGLSVSAALTQLTFSSKRIAQQVKKVLQSAVANAENNHNLNVDDLMVAEAYVGKSLVMKRFHTRGRGRSARILKPFSNITIVVREQGADHAETKKVAKKAKTKAPSAKKETKAKPAVKKPAAKKSTKKESE